MNATSRAILQTVLATDASLSAAERSTTRCLMGRERESPAVAATRADEKLLVTQKRAAELLSVSRATIWRMTKDGLLHPIEIIPGTWRYPLREIIERAHKGMDAGAQREKSAA